MHFQKLSFLALFAMVIALSQLDSVRASTMHINDLEWDSKYVRYKIERLAIASTVHLPIHFTEGSKTLLCPAIEDTERAINMLSLELDEKITQFAENVDISKPGESSDVLLKVPYLWLKWVLSYSDKFMPKNQPKLQAKLIEALNQTIIIYTTWRGKVQEFIEKKEGNWAHGASDTIQILPLKLSLLFEKGFMSVRWVSQLAKLQRKISTMGFRAIPDLLEVNKRLSKVDEMIPYFMAAAYLNLELPYCTAYSKDMMQWEQPSKPSRAQLLSQDPSRINKATPSQVKIPLIFNDNRGVLECAYFDAGHDRGEEVVFSKTKINDFFEMDREYLQDTYEKLNKILKMVVKKFDGSVRGNSKFSDSPDFASRYGVYEEGDTSAAQYFTETYFETLFESYPLLKSYSELIIHLSERYSRLILMHNSIPQAIKHFVTKLENREADPSVGWNKELTGIDMKLKPNKIAFLEFEPVFDYSLFDELLAKIDSKIPNTVQSELSSLKRRLQQHEWYLPHWAKLTFYKVWFKACRSRIY